MNNYPLLQWSKPMLTKWRNPVKLTRPTYGSWANMKYRCFNKNHPQYQEYGGRGVSVCDEWKHDYDAFYESMGPRPKGMSLDRIDNNLWYSPDNCRWATPAEQSRNTRRNSEIVFKDFAAEKGINYSTLMNRKRAGNPLDAPVKSYTKGNGHGTLSRYIKLKCRCKVCRSFYSQYQKDRRK